MRIDYPPPSNWQDLEELAKMITDLIWDKGSSTLYGRQGQDQGGIDVVCYDPGFEGGSLNVSHSKIEASGKHRPETP